MVPASPALRPHLYDTMSSQESDLRTYWERATFEWNPEHPRPVCLNVFSDTLRYPMSAVRILAHPPTVGLCHSAPGPRDHSRSWETRRCSCMCGWLGTLMWTGDDRGGGRHGGARGPGRSSVAAGTEDTCCACRMHVKQPHGIMKHWENRYHHTACRVIAQVIGARQYCRGGVAHRMASDVLLGLAAVGLVGDSMMIGSNHNDHDAGSRGRGRLWVRTHSTPPPEWTPQQQGQRSA